MSRKTYNVLFLCTGNSARSIMAEALINSRGGGRFRGFSAGSYPKGEVHRLALELLEQMKMPTAGLRSKSWDEFTQPGAPRLDFVFTVCDNAAGEQCPLWPGQPVTAHWGVADPATAGGADDERRREFRRIFRALEQRIQAFMKLPVASLDSMTLERRLDAIGRLGVPDDP